MAATVAMVACQLWPMVEASSGIGCRTLYVTRRHTMFERLASHVTEQPCLPCSRPTRSAPTPSPSYDESP